VVNTRLFFSDIFLISKNQVYDRIIKVVLKKRSDGK